MPKRRADARRFTGRAPTGTVVSCAMKCVPTGRQVGADRDDAHDALALTPSRIYAYELCYRSDVYLSKHDICYVTTLMSRYRPLSARCLIDERKTPPVLPRDGLLLSSDIFEF